MNGNSPCAARVPPTTGVGAACAETGWSETVARATAPRARTLLMPVNFFEDFNVLPLVGGWKPRGGTPRPHDTTAVARIE
jgi:hypothetical protein